MPTPARWPERVAVLIAAVALVIVIGLGCTSVFQNDDFLQILALRLQSNPALFQQLYSSTLPSGAVGEYLFTPHIYWADYFRPATRLLQAALWDVFGMHPLPYHILNLLLHLVAIILVARLAMALNFGTTVAWWSALIFAIHPTHGEPVIWIGGMGGLAAAVCFLFALLLLTRFHDGGRAHQIILAVGMAILALLFKEDAATLPLAAIVLAWRQREHRRRAIWSVVVMSTLVFGWLAWRAIVGASVTPAALQLSFNPLTWMRNALFYATQLLVPVRFIFRLMGDFSAYFRLRELLTITPHAPTYAVAVAGIAVAALVFAARNWKYQGAATRLGTLLTLATIAPVLAFLQSAHRLIYIPSAGFALMLAGWSFSDSAKPWRRYLLCLWVAVMSVALVEQSHSWQHAGHLSSEILDKAAVIRRDIPAGTATVFVDLPDRYFGAYLFTSGFREGLILKTDLAYIEIHDPAHNTFDPRSVPADARWFRWTGSGFEECEARPSTE